MAYMVDIGPALDMFSGRPSLCEWLAIGFLRRVAHAAHCSLGSSVGVPEPSMDLACAEEAFCSFLVAAQQDAGAREPYFAHPSSPLLTRDERRLLRALAAAQAGDEALLDNYLYKLALGSSPRAQLAQAMRALAAALTVQGHRVPSSKAQQVMVPRIAAKARGQGPRQFNAPVPGPMKPA
jgi:hypothetical protein